MKGRPAPERRVQIEGQPLNDVLDEAMIDSVVHAFYDRVRKDDLLGPIFNGAIPPESWPSHLAKLCDFWSSILLRTRRYKGQPLQPHVAIPQITDAHFQRWLSLFQATVHLQCPPDIESLFMDRALRIAHSFRMAIAFNRGQSTVEIQPITVENLENVP